MGFPYKTPAQVPHSKTRPGYNLAKTWLPEAVPSSNCFNQHKPVFCGLLFIFMLIVMGHNSDVVGAK